MRCAHGRFPTLHQSRVPTSCSAPGVLVVPWPTHATLFLFMYVDATCEGLRVQGSECTLPRSDLLSPTLRIPVRQIIRCTGETDHLLRGACDWCRAHPAVQASWRSCLVVIASAPSKTWSGPQRNYCKSLIKRKDPHRRCVGSAESRPGGLLLIQ
jgi:hypothetical protein